MNIKRFIINSILGIILFNGIAFLAATLRHVPFQFSAFYGVAVPIVAGLASALVRTPKERADRL